MLPNETMSNSTIAVSRSLRAGGIGTWLTAKAVFGVFVNHGAEKPRKIKRFRSPRLTQDANSRQPALSCCCRTT
jgi:hypothetical protein